jgi:hypothetical protein
VSAAQQPTGLDDPGYQHALYSAALLYVSRGWSIIPLAPIRYRPDGKKRIQPLIKWVTEPGQLVTRTDQVEQWFGPAGAARGIAVATGPSGLFMLDSDAYKDGAEERNPPPGSWVERHAGRGGWHAYLSNPTGARNTAGRIGTGVDSRGDGGLSVCAPTRSLHPDGSTTQWQNVRPLIELQQLPPAPAELLAAAPVKIRHLGAVGEATEVSPAAAAESVRRWREDYLATTHGGRHTALIQYLAVLTRHRLAEGIAVQDVVGELEAAALAHPDAVAGEEFQSVPDAIEWAIDKARSGPWIIVEETGLFAASPPLPETPALDPDGGDPFAFTDEDYEGTVELPEAAYGAFGGGKPLFYPDKVHWLQGESDSGKSWLGLGVLVDVVREGGTGWVLDYENSRAEFAGRLKALGLPKDAMLRVSYLDGTSLTSVELRGYIEAFGQRADVLLVDGVTGALSALGKSGRDEQEFGQWFDAVPARAKMAICVDHVVKSLDDRRGMAVGTQAKKGRPDVAYEVRCVVPFSRTKPGVVELVMQKDRHGGIGMARGERAQISVTPEDDGRRVTLGTTADQGGLFGSDPNAALFSALLADGIDGGIGVNELAKACRDRGQGYGSSGPRRAAMHKAWLEYYVESMP